MRTVSLGLLEPMWMLLEENRIGIEFRCPVCPKSGHRLEFGWAGSPTFWKSGRLWRAKGNAFETLTFLGELEGASQTKERCQFVGYLENGKVRWA